MTKDNSWEGEAAFIEWRKGQREDMEEWNMAKKKARRDEKRRDEDERDEMRMR